MIIRLSIPTDTSRNRRRGPGAEKMAIPRLWHRRCNDHAMKETSFFVAVNLKTPGGSECIARFYIGKKRKPATDIFLQLKGRKEIDEKAILTLDLVESRDGLPLNMQMINCSLEELAENCKIITKEVFKLLNLEEIK